MELSIVLVVIGLLLGSTLKGHVLVEEARIRRIAMETVALAEALRSYRALYHAWPGDDSQAASRWSGSRNGNGNGMLEGNGLPERPEGESGVLWSHLRHAGLVTGEASDPTPPRHSLGGHMGVGQGVLGVPGLAICLEELPAVYATGYDRQFDDGQWDGGRIRSSGPTTAGWIGTVCSQL
ncbi:MAG: hypothetical protein H7837_07225 [Magnetococcus sp. MYC-9]